MIISGTLVNMCGIVLGGTTGLLGRNRINEKYQTVMLQSTGLCLIFIGIVGTLEKMLVIENGSISTQGSMILLVSMVVGSLIGELLNLEAMFVKGAEWMKHRTGNDADSGFVNAFITASFAVVIGAMGIIGAMEEGMLGSHDVLFMKAIIDFVMILALTAALGKGCLFSAIPVGIWQVSVTLASKEIAPFMTECAIDYIGMTGSVLICCIGVNLIKNKFSVANMVPAILIAGILGFAGL